MIEHNRESARDDGVFWLFFSPSFFNHGLPIIIQDAASHQILSTVSEPSKL